MFGSKNFSSPLGDDILNSFIQDTAKRTHSQRTASLTEADEKHLLSTKKLVQQLEEEESQTKKAPVIKTTSSLAQSNVIKKKPVENKASDDVDDLLDFIEGTTTDKPTKKTIEPTPVIKPSPKLSSQAAIKQTESNKFAEELIDEEEDVPGYDPTIRNPVKKSVNPPPEDISKKKNALFGLSNSVMTSMNKSQTNSDSPNSQFQTKLQQRPQTMETPQVKEEDELGEINIGASRIKGKNTAKKRPLTTEGELKANQESKLSIPARPWTGNSADIEMKEGEKEGEEEVESEYLSSFLSRDKKDKKFGMSTLKTVDSQKASPGRIGINPVTADTSPPQKSPRSEFVMSKDGFFPKEVPHQFITTEKKEESSISRNPVGILGKKDLSEPPIYQQIGGRNLATIGSFGPRKERIDGAGSRQENLQMSGVSVWEGSIREGGIGGHGEGIKDITLPEYLKETEEYYKRRAKESEEYYENRYKQLKKAMDEEKLKWEELHEKELRLVKKENEDLKEHMSKHLERERERMKEMFMIELESKDKIHNYELQRQRHQFEEENASLKKQLEAQAKLNLLADEIKNSSKKLISMSDKMEQEKSLGTYGMKGELREKEKQIEELEKRLKHEIEMVHNERKRLDRIRIELDNRDIEDKKSLEKEKELLRQEYNRINELQDAIRRQELEKVRNLEKQKSLYDLERAKLEKESIRIKEEFSKKYHDLEVQIELHNMRKQEFEKILNKTETDFLKKQQEMEAAMKRLSAMEVDFVKRIKELENNEILIEKCLQESQRKLDLLELERIAFEKEKSQVVQMAEQTREDTNKMRRFRQDFEEEQQKNILLKTELATFATNLRNERNQLAEEKNNFAMINKTLEGLKHDYIKDLTQNPLEDVNKIMGNNVREKSPDLVIEKPPLISVPPSTRLGSTYTVYEGRENQFPEVHRNNFVTMSQDPRYVKISDLKKENNIRTMLKGKQEAQDINIHANNILQLRAWAKSISHSDPMNPIHEHSVQNTEVSNKVSVPVNTPSQFVSKVQTPEKFNYRNYMAQLKDLDHTSNINQEYIETEKEELFHRKLSTGSAFVGGRSRSEKIY